MESSSMTENWSKNIRTLYFLCIIFWHFYPDSFILWHFCIFASTEKRTFLFSSRIFKEFSDIFECHRKIQWWSVILRVVTHELFSGWCSIHSKDIIRRGHIEFWRLWRGGVTATCNRETRERICWVLNSRNRVGDVVYYKNKKRVRGLNDLT